jgi:hypothetical protein
LRKPFLFFTIQIKKGGPNFGSRLTIPDKFTVYKSKSETIFPIMNIPVHILSQSKSPPGEESEPPSEGSEKAPQYSNFDKVIREEFGIINHIELLFSQSNEKTSQGTQGLDQSND